MESMGNPFTHIILRGSNSRPNFDPLSIESAIKQLVEHHLEPRLLIDCSHGNSGKNLERQKSAFISVIEQAASLSCGGIAGLMLESHLVAGKQPLADDPDKTRLWDVDHRPLSFLGRDRRAHPLGR